MMAPVERLSGRKREADADLPLDHEKKRRIYRSEEALEANNASLAPEGQHQIEEELAPEGQHQIEEEEASAQAEAPVELNSIKERRRVERKERKQRKQPIEELPCIYGNYRRYYGYRRSGDDSDDPRVACMERSWIEGKRVVDIGCNSGLLTLQVARNLSPSSMEGIDLDGTLVEAARKRVRGAKKSGKGAQCPISFFKGDFLEERRIRDASVACALCMSVIKWIHLHRGDQGVTDLFEKVFRVLEPGGVFVLEVQPWTSYKKNKNVSEITRKNFALLKRRPEEFTTLLAAVGFRVDELKPPDQAQGFKRPIFACTKPREAANAAKGITTLESEASAESPVRNEDSSIPATVNGPLDVL